MAGNTPSGAPPAGSAGSTEGSRATAALVKDIVGGTQSLVRGELELARLELMEGLSAKGQAAGAAGAAGMLGLYVLGFLGLAGGDREQRQRYARTWRWARQRSPDHEVHVEGRTVRLFPPGGLETAGEYADSELRIFADWLVLVSVSYSQFL